MKFRIQQNSKTGDYRVQYRLNFRIGWQTHEYSLDTTSGWELPTFEPHRYTTKAQALSAAIQLKNDLINRKIPVRWETVQEFC